jgi:O-antigen/teichoic acid export membrane protein
MCAQSWLAPVATKNVRDELSAELSLRKRALRAGIWTLGAHGVDMVTRLISTLIMTRLLFPEAFGLVAAATSLVVGLALLSDLGIRTVILQSPRGDQNHFLRSAWTLQALRGLALWLILVFLCVISTLGFVRRVLPADSVFADPQFALITAALGLGLVIGGLESTAIHLNVRRLNLRPIYLLDMASRLISLPVMIIWAWLSPSVWVIVGGGLVGSLVRVTLSHISIAGPTMSAQWDREHVREIVHFGKWINVSSAATFIAGQSDRIIMGLLFPSSAFGLYAIARQVIDTSQGLFERLNAALGLPLLSEISRKSPHEIREKYYLYRRPFDSAPLVGGFLFSAGPQIISLLFDERYVGAGQMVSILGIDLLVFPTLLIGVAFTASGVPQMGALISGIQASSLIASMIGGYLLAGEWGALWGIALHKFVPSLVVIAIARQREWIDMRKELWPLPAFAAGVILGWGLRLLTELAGFSQ